MTRMEAPAPARRARGPAGPRRADDESPRCRSPLVHPAPGGQRVADRHDGPVSHRSDLARRRRAGAPSVRRRERRGDRGHAPRAPPPDTTRLPADRFLDRTASWLQFNARVLELAADPDVPLLERVRFIAIFSRNLDEFFMVRVAALRSRVAAGVTTPGAERCTRRASGSTGSRELAHELVADAGPAGHRASCCPALAARAASRSCGGRTSRKAERRQLRRRCSPSGSTRSSRRWPSTRRTRSPTSPGCR